MYFADNLKSPDFSSIKPPVRVAGGFFWGGEFRQTSHKSRANGPIELKAGMHKFLKIMWRPQVMTNVIFKE